MSMKNLFYSTAFCAAALIGFSACSDSLTDIPETPDTRTVILPDVWIEGPSSIELGQLYFFEVVGNSLGNDQYDFKVEDTYFNDPSSYAIYVSPSGNRIGLIFNKYGHYKITATMKNTSWTCSYEVAKYYKNIHFLKYRNDAPKIQIGMALREPLNQWFECYMNRNLITMDYSGRITDFDNRIVVNVMKGNQLFWWSAGVGPTITSSITDTVVTGIADKGDNVITIPDERIIRHPKSSSTTLDYGYIVPWCNGTYTIPTERCGVL